MANPLLKTRQIADLQVTNGKLASDVGRANLLTNGGFEIWQRGTGPFTNGVCADRWGINKTAGDTLSVSVEGSASNIDIRSQFCAAVTYVRSSGGSNVEQNLTGDGLARYRGGALSFSVRVKCATANAVKIRIYSDTETASAYHTGSGAYETLTVTKVLGATPANLFVSIVFDASCTAYIDNAMLVVGNVAADYAPLHPADDLARCLRYYEVIGGQTVGVPQFFGYSTNTQWSTTLPYKARKAVSPVVTKTGTWAVTNCNQPSLVGELDSVVIYTVVTATGHFNIASNAAGQTITIEANP